MNTHQVEEQVSSTNSTAPKSVAVADAQPIANSGSAKRKWSDEDEVETAEVEEPGYDSGFDDDAAPESASPSRAKRTRHDQLPYPLEFDIGDYVKELRTRDIQPVEDELSLKPLPEHPLLNIVRMLQLALDAKQLERRPFAAQSLVTSNPNAQHYTKADLELVHSYLQPATLERYFFAFDSPKLLFAYIYLEYYHRLFSSPAPSDPLEGAALIRRLLPEDVAEDAELVEDMAVAHYSFHRAPTQSFTLQFRALQMPWNWLILVDVEDNRASRMRGCPATRHLRADQEYLFPVDMCPRINFYDHFDRDLVTKLARAYFGGNAANANNVALFRSLSTFQRDEGVDSAPVAQFFASKARAPALNGVACVGKTTLINAVLNCVRSNIDPNANVLKLGQFGGFAGKDRDQILAMQVYPVMMDSSEEHYTSIMDRCPFNNWIWRFILLVINAQRDVVTDFVELLTEVSPQMIEVMRKWPVLIILDTDVQANRQRMYRRNNGTDRQRSKLPNYVGAQNMVYGVLAHLVGWPVYNAGLSLIEGRAVELLGNLLVRKVKMNVAAHGNRVPTKPIPEKFKLRPTVAVERALDYQPAYECRIMK